MPQLQAPGDRVAAGPKFYVTPRPRVSPASVLLAILLASVGAFAFLHAQTHARYAGGADSAGGDDDDDPSQVDTIYLGGPNEAPVAKRPGSKPNMVHPFVVIHLPSGGDQAGQIPATDAGRLLYAWMAAFNGPDPASVTDVLPVTADPEAKAAQVELRKQTGGFTLLSAKEIQPGLLVFRLHDQTKEGTEALGTLQVRAGSQPPAIASFSLRQVQPSPGKAD